MRHRLLLPLLLACSILTGAIGCSHENAPTATPPGPEQQEQLEPDSSNQRNVFKGDGWKFEYSKNFDVVSEDPPNLYIQQSSTGLTVQLRTGSYTPDELNAWIQSEIDRKLSAEEADVTLIQPLQQASTGSITEYRYTTRSDNGGQTPVDIPVVILSNGAEMVEFRTHLPPATEEQLESIVRTFVFE